MKQAIHPEIHHITARCACGNAFATTSILPDIKVTICSNCHPYYTGAQKFVDTAGRIEKFKSKYEKKEVPGKKAKK